MMATEQRTTPEQRRALRARYTPEPVPGCPHCGGKMVPADFSVSPGVPAIAFKNAAVTACTQIDGITKVLARGAFHVLGDILPIDGGEPVLDEQMVRVGMGTADIRYRARFDTWRVTLRVMYNASVMNEAQIAHLINTAGFAVGVCEHRPERDGSNGMFHVADGGE